MDTHYTSEENVLQLIALLKAHGIKKVVASPGSTNITFVGSIQNDTFFEIYSCVDERSAAYMACGLAEECGEPVVISCTGATAARNYSSGLTEAFYRKLPILAITSSQPFGRIGQLSPQFTDRNNRFNDVSTLSVQIPYPYSEEERWSNNVKINNAILQLKRRNGGPAHINISSNYERDFSRDKLPSERVIRRYFEGDVLPEINAERICIFVGSHKKFDKTIENEIDKFCRNFNAIVLCDQTSNFKGEYRVLGGLLAAQFNYWPACRKMDLVIHLGEVSGSYYNFTKTKVWRVNSDGEVRDTFRMLTNVFEMEEKKFFEYYNNHCSESKENCYLEEWKSEEKKLQYELQDLPFSNAWLCQHTACMLPENAVLHLGILNSLRSWNLFDVPNSVYTYCNVGGFGIDGGLSSCIGASFANPKKLYFCVLGDLATFYDINSLGNRHIGNNLRIIVVNNGCGFEMHCSACVGSGFPDNEIDRYFAASGHFGSKSRSLLKNYAESLGFEYLKAESKEEYLMYRDYFVSQDIHDKPILFEVFVDENDDKLAYDLTKNIIVSATGTAKHIAKSVLGEKGYAGLKKMFKK